MKEKVHYARQYRSFLVTKSFLVTLFRVGVGSFYWHDEIYEYVDRVSKDEGNEL